MKFPSWISLFSNKSRRRDGDEGGFGRFQSKTEDPQGEGVEETGEGKAMH